MFIQYKFAVLFIIQVKLKRKLNTYFRKKALKLNLLHKTYNFELNDEPILV